ncbi:hypothetical protein L798_04494 [Zootermopsis nevadensis]|uniref:Uncharacterized protein n=1 Tax=Zootermopsis nevadensis TaxID=136037 RepID=A0A067RAT5_ZOONE|nr:hypothetical protein L798_04494 [Zootermopsis nevadensis]
MTTEEEQSTTRPLENIPILKDESTPVDTVVTSNGQTLSNGDTRNEDVQTENIHPSPRGIIAQVSSTICAKTLLSSP